MRLVERTYFALCLTLGRLLRAARYSKARIVDENGEVRVRKRRVFYAPLLIWLGGPLAGTLDTGVRVLPRREWQARERSLYRSLYAAVIRVDRDGTLVLPRFPGETLAVLLDQGALAEPVRTWAIERAAVALAEFHRHALTHGDAMAENVLVDIEGGMARWFDFETVHDPRRSMAWRRADDVRALLVTCLIRTAPERRAETFRIILDAYTRAYACGDACAHASAVADAGGADERVALMAHLTAAFGGILRRALTFHLAQAALSFRSFDEVARVLGARSHSHAGFGDRSSQKNTLNSRGA